MCREKVILTAVRVPSSTILKYGSTVLYNKMILTVEDVIMVSGLPENTRIGHNILISCKFSWLHIGRCHGTFLDM